MGTAFIIAVFSPHMGKMFMCGFLLSWYNAFMKRLCLLFLLFTGPVVPLSSDLFWSPGKSGVMALNQTWRFYPGRFLAPGKKLPDSGFLKLSVPGIWPALPGVKNDGYGTYVLRVHGIPVGVRMGLFIPYLASSCRIYCGTNLVFTAGSPGRNASSTGLSWKTGLVDIGTASSEGIFEFTVHIANYGYYKGGFHAPLRLGVYRKLLRQKTRFGSILYFLLGSLFIMGIYHLFLFLLRRKDRSPFYFALFCLLVALRALVSGSNPVYALLPGISFGMLYSLYMFSQVGAVFVFLKYMESLFPDEVHPFFLRIASCILLFLSIFTVLAPVGLLSRAGIVFDVLTVVIFCYCILIFGLAVERKRDGAGLIALGFLFMIVTVVHDMLLEYGVIHSVLLLPFGVFLLVFSQSVLLSRRFSRSFRDVEFLTRSLERKVELRTEELSLERDRLSEKNRLLERELDLARQIQHRLIPGNRPGSNIDFLYKPMAKVGGDFFDFIRYRDGSLGVLLSDVSGHGVPAAFVTSMIKSFLLQHGKGFESPSQLLYGLNDFLMPLTGGNFVTAFYGIICEHDRRFIYANAGHNFPFLISGEGASMLKGAGKGLPLSIMKNRELRSLQKGYSDDLINLPAGSKLFLYTDGLVEAFPVRQNIAAETSWEQSYEGRRMDAILDTVREDNCRGVISKIHDDLVRFRGSAEFDDDVCMICVDVI